VRDRWASPGDRALYVFIKERKFGTGCIDTWAREREEYLTRANELLEPTVRTLSAQPFLFGARPSLADLALYGEFAMLTYADPQILGRFDPAFASWLRRLDELAAAARS
jgi:glutathione S-transferase